MDSRQSDRHPDWGKPANREPRSARPRLDERLVDELENAGRLAEEIREELVEMGISGATSKAEQVCETLSTALVRTR
jgi:hypothetical protein